MGILLIANGQHIAVPGADRTINERSIWVDYVNCKQNSGGV